MGKTYRYWSKEEKLRIVNMTLEGRQSTWDISKELDISNGMLNNWIRMYRENGEAGLENKTKPGNPLQKYRAKKVLTKEEQLEYENMKLRIELERLKKGYIVKGVGQKKEYISISKKSSK